MSHSLLSGAYRAALEINPEFAPGALEHALASKDTDLLVALARLAPHDSKSDRTLGALVDQLLDTSPTGREFSVVRAWVCRPDRTLAELDHLLMRLPQAIRTRLAAVSADSALAEQLLLPTMEWNAGVPLTLACNRKLAPKLRTRALKRYLESVVSPELENSAELTTAVSELGPDLSGLCNPAATHALLALGMISPDMAIAALGRALDLLEFVDRYELIALLEALSPHALRFPAELRTRCAQIELDEYELRSSSPLADLLAAWRLGAPEALSATPAAKLPGALELLCSRAPAELASGAPARGEALALLAHPEITLELAAPLVAALGPLTEEETALMSPPSVAASLLVSPEDIDEVLTAYTYPVAVLSHLLPALLARLEGVRVSQELADLVVAALSIPALPGELLDQLPAEPMLSSLEYASSGVVCAVVERVEKALPSAQHRVLAEEIMRAQPCLTLNQVSDVVCASLVSSRIQ